jgi:CRP-like cAMP-binding protein
VAVVRQQADPPYQDRAVVASGGQEEPVKTSGHGDRIGRTPILTSHCDQTAWQIQPVRCWQYSWQALSAPVEGNMAATRGWPVIVVQLISSFRGALQRGE